MDDIRVAPNDFRRQGFGAGRILLSTVTFDLEVLSLDLPQPPKLSEKGSELLLSLCSCKSALGSDGLKIARRLLLVLCCAAAASGHATAAPPRRLMKSRRLMQPSKEAQDHAKSRSKHTTPRHGSLGCWGADEGHRILRCAMTVMGQSGPDGPEI